MQLFFVLSKRRNPFVLMYAGLFALFTGIGRLHDSSAACIFPKLVIACGGLPLSVVLSQIAVFVSHAQTSFR
jgi:hypothetical protein